MEDFHLLAASCYHLAHFASSLLRRLGKNRVRHVGTILVLYIFGLEHKPVPRRIEVEQEYFEMWHRHQDFWQDLAKGDPVACYPRRR